LTEKSTSEYELDSGAHFVKKVFSNRDWLGRIAWAVSREVMASNRRSSSSLLTIALADLVAVCDVTRTYRNEVKAKRGIAMNMLEIVQAKIE
jgi:hypothetical protein